MTGSVESLLEEMPGPVSSPLFVDLLPYFTGEMQPELPTVAVVPGEGRGLFYRGRLNEVHAEPSVGKSNVAIAAALLVVKSGGRVIYIDPEDTPSGFVRRVRAFGGDPESVIGNLQYLHNPLPEAFAKAIAFVSERPADLVVLDGLAESLAAEGKDENLPLDILGFFRERLRPFADRGAAVVIADHVVKDASGRGRWARGSGAKLGRYDGVSYELTIGKAYTPTEAGHVRMKVSKDRNGGVGPGGFIAWDCNFTPDGEGCTKVEFRPPSEWRPTELMAKVTDYLKANESANTRTLRGLGNHDFIDKAIACLMSDGALEMRREGNANVYRLANSGG